MLGASSTLRPGIAFAVRPLLRAAIVLLGLSVTLGQLLDLGIGALALAVVVVASTLPFSVWLGGRLGVDRRAVQRSLLVWPNPLMLLRSKSAPEGGGKIVSRQESGLFRGARRTQ
jgi:hypothetical protein